MSIAAAYRITKKTGVERVSESACKERAKVLEELGVKIGGESLEFVMYAGRKAIKEKGIKIAARKVMNH